MGDNHKYLVLGVNNRLDLMQFNLQLGEKFDVFMHDSKPCGTLVNIVRTIDNQVLAADIMKGLTVFDVKETRSSVELIEGPSSPHSCLWINDILILSPSRYLVVDKERNFIVFERNLKPTNEIQTFKLSIVAQASFGEEVTSAVLGSMSVHAAQGQPSKSTEAKKETLKRKERDSKPDVIMEETAAMDSLTKEQLERINPSQDFIR